MIRPKPKRQPDERKTIVSGYIEKHYRARFLELLHEVDPELTISDGIAQLIRAHVNGDSCPDCIRNDIHCRKHSINKDL